MTLHPPTAGWEPFRHRHPALDVRPVDGPAVERAVRQATAAGVDPWRVRLDAVTLTAAAVVGQQLCETFEMAGTPLDPDDRALARRWDELVAILQCRFPWLLPDGAEPDWPDGALQTFARALAGHDLLYGREQARPPMADPVSAAFAHAGHMGGKQQTFSAFHTPAGVAHALVLALSTDRLYDEALCEPAVGTGVLVLATWDQVARQLRARLDDDTMDAGQMADAVARWVGRLQLTDIDPDAAWACALNVAAHTGVAPHVRCGNALFGTGQAAVACWPAGDRRSEVGPASDVRLIRAATAAARLADLADRPA